MNKLLKDMLPVIGVPKAVLYKDMKEDMITEGKQYTSYSSFCHWVAGTDNRRLFSHELFYLSEFIASNKAYYDKMKAFLDRVDMKVRDN